jgi:hypothetical protein
MNAWIDPSEIRSLPGWGSKISPISPFRCASQNFLPFSPMRFWACEKLRQGVPSGAMPYE